MAQPANIVDQAIEALRALRPTPAMPASRLLPMWAHYDKLTEAQRREVLSRFDR